MYCAPGTSHYSFEKGASLLGLGDSSVISIEVDSNCRMNLDSKYYYNLALWNTRCAHYEYDVK